MIAEIEETLEKQETIKYSSHARVGKHLHLSIKISIFFLQQCFLYYFDALVHIRHYVSVL